MFLKKFKKIINNKLFEAFSSEDLDKVKKCLALGANINHHFPKLNYATLLHYAPTMEMMKELLNLGADINALDHTGSTALHVYVTVGKSKLAMELIRLKADVNIKSNCGQTPLHLAIIHGRELLLVRELLKSGADVNWIDRYCNSPLNYAVNRHTDLEVSKELLQYGGSLKIRQKHSNLILGPFEEALMWGNLEHAQLFIRFTLLKHGGFVSILRFECFTKYANHVTMLTYIDECSNEINEMKKEKIGNKSLYDIVVSKVEKVKPLSLSNKTEEDFRMKYRIYSDLILDKLRYWLLRARLFRSLEYLSDSYTFSYVLNHDCICKIVEYLSNDDLANLIDACIE